MFKLKNVKRRFKIGCLNIFLQAEGRIKWEMESL